jgi:D-alanyl-D-alanine dipeptidase
VEADDRVKMRRLLPSQHSDGARSEVALESDRPGVTQLVGLDQMNRRSSAERFPRGVEEGHRRRILRLAHRDDDR